MVRRLAVLSLVLILTAIPASAAEKALSLVAKGATAGSYSLPSLQFTALSAPDQIELPVVLSQDNIPVVYPSLVLNPATNVDALFPTRSRSDSNYYIVDFTLAELRQLSINDFPDQLEITTHIPSLQETLRLLEHFAAVTMTEVKPLPVIKYPWFFNHEQRDISAVVLETLADHFTTDSGDTETTLALKCYDPDELQRIKKQLLAKHPLEIELIQGIDRKGGDETMRRTRNTWTPYNFEWAHSRIGLRALSGYADTLSLKISPNPNRQQLDSFLNTAHGLNMKVYFEIPASKTSAETRQLEKTLDDLSPDGLVLADPAQAKRYRQTSITTPAEQDTLFPPTTDSQDISPLLSDPEKLRERLQELE